MHYCKGVWENTGKKNIYMYVHYCKGVWENTGKKHFNI